jgi:hypothetical protein
LKTKSLSLNKEHISELVFLIIKLSSDDIAAFLSGSLLHIYEKQTTWRYKRDKRVYDVDFAEFCLWKVNVDPILCLV